MNKNNSISFVISSKIALHTAKPYIFELQKRKKEIFFLVSDDVFDEVNRIKIDGDNIEKISNYKRINKIAVIMHQFLIVILTPTNFSSLYSRWLAQKFRNKNIFVKFIAKFLVNIFPKVKREKINNIITCIITFFIKQNLPSNKIINITISTIPFLLANKNKKIYSILESWDHPGKNPMGFTSRKVFLWNQNMKDEWIKYQNDKDIYFSYPMKLAYAIHPVISNKEKKQVVMYPFTTSAESPHVGLYEEEVKFVHYLCQVLNELNYMLMIKPKPNTKIGELDFFTSYSNVTICSYQENGGGSSYGLSDEYNNIRLKELSMCDYIITRGTTFAFDTAAYGLPVLQFIFSSSKEFPNLSNLVNYPHISKHIVSKKELLAELTDNDTIENQLTQILQDPNTIKKAEQFRDYLRDWLIPEESMEESVSRVIDEILKDD